MTSPADRAERAPDIAANHVEKGDLGARGLEAGDIRPDTKDWTWVLHRPCPDCGFDAGSVSGPQVADLVRHNADQWPSVCARGDVGVRPQPGVWSPLEYACHVRDVCRVFESRVDLMRSQVSPAFESWNQDDAAIAGAYSAQDPSVVSAQLLSAAADAAAAFDAIGQDDWQRTGRRSNGSIFTLETLGQYFLHDVAHHLHDVGR